jgi:hypothetical protein
MNTYKEQIVNLLIALFPGMKEYILELSSLEDNGLRGHEALEYFRDTCPKSFEWGKFWIKANMGKVIRARMLVNQGFDALMLLASEPPKVTTDNNTSDDNTTWECGFPKVG